MICPKCNASLPNDSEFCQHCGNKILTRTTASTISGIDENCKQHNDLNLIKPQTRKERFCSICGGKIDTETKKCTKCGKQYFKGITISNKIKNIAMICIIVMLIGLCVYQFLFNRNLNQKNIVLQQTIEDNTAEINELESKINEQNQIIESTNDRIDILEKSRLEYAKKAEFYDEYVVIVVNGSRNYHKYGCSEVRTTELLKNGFKILSVDEAKSQGYHPCGGSISCINN